MASLDNQTQIRGKSTVVGSTGSLVVLVRSGDVVGELSRALLDITLVVGLAVILVLFGKGLGLIDGEDGADKSSVGDTAERVARGANLLVDLETTAEAINELAIKMLIDT